MPFEENFTSNRTSVNMAVYRFLFHYFSPSMRIRGILTADLQLNSVILGKASFNLTTNATEIQINTDIKKRFWLPKVNEIVFRSISGFRWHFCVHLKGGGLSGKCPPLNLKKGFN